MKAKVTIDGKEHEITLTEEQIMQFRENWEAEYRGMLIEKHKVRFLSVTQTNEKSFNAYFINSEIANEVLDKMELLARMTQFALLRNGDWVADCGNFNQRKYGILILKSSKAKQICLVDISTSYLIESGEYMEHNHFVFGIAVKTMEIAKEMLSIFEEDIIKYYK